MELNCKKCTLRLRSVSVIMQLFGYFTKLGFGDFANEAGASRPSATGIVLSDRDQRESNVSVMCAYCN